MMWRRLDEIASLGLPVLITELSLVTNWTDAGPVCALTEAEQAEMLERLVTLFYSHPAVAGVTLWGFWDGHMWVQGTGLYRKDFTPKPAAAWQMLCKLL